VQDLDLSPEALIARYERAAGKAATIELKLRILAEVVPELEHLAHGYKLDEDRIMKWFADNGDQLSPGDKEIFSVSRTFRNKLLHGDLRLAREHMHRLGGEQRRSGGLLLRLDPAAGGVREQFDATLAAGPMEAVADTETADSGIGAWLMEFALTGDFEQAAHIFAKTSELADALIDRAHAILLRKSRQTRPQ
jgi:hypothetical protein